MSAKSGELPMEVCGSALIGCVRFFWGVEKTEIVVFAASSDLRDPFFTWFAPGNAFKSGFIAGFLLHVPQVFRSRSLSKVFPTIVASVSIFVVDVVLWPNTCHHKPNYSVRRPVGVVNCNSTVPVPVFLNACDFPGVSPIPLGGGVFSMLPAKKPRLWVIIQKTTSIVCRQILAHLQARYMFLRSHTTLLGSLWSGFRKGVGGALLSPQYAKCLREAQQHA